MSRFLVFLLEAPLAAMGDVAVGERRYGADRPARSAVFGLVAAALGIERGDDQAHRRLSDGYGYAVRVDGPGTLLEDYHTAQVPPARRGRRWATRRDELAEPALETILSLRDYRENVRHAVALWAHRGAPHTLEELAAALRRPRFRLYHGRRACPLGCPPAARVIDAENLAEAFHAYDAGEGLPPVQAPVYADLSIADRLGPGLRVDRMVRRRDLLISRGRWQFGLRDELVAVPAGGAP